MGACLLFIIPVFTIQAQDYDKAVIQYLSVTIDDEYSWTN